jgi:hypothetical protein
VAQVSLRFPNSGQRSCARAEAWETATMLSATRLGGDGDAGELELEIGKLVRLSWRLQHADCGPRYAHHRSHLVWNHDGLETVQPPAARGHGNSTRARLVDLSAELRRTPKSPTLSRHECSHQSEGGLQIFHR